MVSKTLKLNKEEEEEEDIKSLRKYVKKCFSKDNYMKFIGERLFCHPNFLKDYDFSKLDEIKKNPSNFQYSLVLMQKVHFGFLFFKDYYPFCSISYSTLFDDVQLLNKEDRDLSAKKRQLDNLKKRSGFISIPDSNYAMMYHIYNSICSQKKTIKKEKGIKTIIKTKLNDFRKKLDLPMIVLTSSITKKQINYLEELIKDKPVYHMKSKTNYYHTGVPVEGLFNILEKINLSAEKKNRFVNCYDFAFQFLKRGGKKAKEKYKKHIKSYTLRIAMGNIIDKVI